MSLPRTLRFGKGKPSLSTSEDKPTFRVSPWSAGIVQGFVIEMKVEGKWLPLSKFHPTESEATEALHEIQRG